MKEKVNIFRRNAPNFDSGGITKCSLQVRYYDEMALPLLTISAPLFLELFDENLPLANVRLFKATERKKKDDDRD